MLQKLSKRIQPAHLKILISGLVLAVLIFLTILFWPKERKSLALKDFITEDAALVIQSKSILQVRNLFEADSAGILSSCPGLDKLSHWVNIFHSHLEPLNSSLVNNPFVAFWRLLENKQWSSTLVLYSGIKEVDEVSQLLKDSKLQYREIEIDGTMLSMEISSSQPKWKLCFAALTDIFVFSEDLESLTKAILSAQNGENQWKELKAQMISSNKSASFNAYWRPSAFTDFLPSLIQEELPFQFQFLSTDTSWVIMDFMVDSQGLSINARKQVVNAWDVFISDANFRYPAVAEVLNQSKVWYAALNTEHFADFYHHYCSFSQHKTPFNISAEQEKFIEDSISFSVENDLLPAVGTHLVWACTHDENGIPHFALALEISDSNAIDIFLHNNQLFQTQKSFSKSVLPYFAYSVFGPLFASADSSFWMEKNHWLFVSENREFLEKWTNNLPENLEGNQAVDWNMRLNWPLLESDKIFNIESLKSIHQTEWAKKTAQLSMDFKRNGSTLFFSLRIPFSKSAKNTQKTTISCPSALDQVPLFFMYKDQQIGVVYAMENRQLVIRGIDGKPFFETIIEEPLLFPLQRAELDGLSYIFALTAHKIYCYSLQGTQKKGFPIEIPDGLSSPVLIVQYSAQDHWRLIFNTKTDVILNFDQNGKTVNGWKKPILSHHANKGTYIKAGKKDLIMFSNQEGLVSVFNRKGELLFKKQWAVSGSGKPLLLGARTKDVLYGISVESHLVECSLEGKAKTVKNNWVDKNTMIFASAHSFFVMKNKNLTEFNGLGEQGAQIKLDNEMSILSIYQQGGKDYILLFNGSETMIVELPNLKLCYKLPGKNDIVFNTGNSWIGASQERQQIVITEP